MAQAAKNKKFARTASFGTSIRRVTRVFPGKDGEYGGSPLLLVEISAFVDGLCPSGLDVDPEDDPRHEYVQAIIAEFEGATAVKPTLPPD